MLKGLRIGIDWALLFTGLMMGARQRMAISKPIFADDLVCAGPKIKFEMAESGLE